ncbi:MAG: SDR family oxidoreductase [Caldilineaceae bacterium]
MPQRNLSGRTTLITGAGSGIGRGIALALARRGASVVLGGRRVAPLAAVAAEVQTLGGAAVIAQGDVTDAAARLHMIATAHAAFGRIDVLVNNAGVLASGALFQLNGEEIARAVATNLTAPIDLTRLALPDLAQTHGATVFVGSTTSHVPLPYLSLYSGTKSGLHGFCTSLRSELAPLGIHVLEVYPPAIATVMTEVMARRAGDLQAPPGTPEDAGERIVAALAGGRRELAWGSGERWLLRLHRHAPGLVDAFLRSQRRRFAHIMTPEPQGQDHHD